MAIEGFQSGLQSRGEFERVEFFALA
jgi:hypothetical protein